MTNDRKDVYSRVTDRIIADLERGVRTWMLLRLALRQQNLNLTQLTDNLLRRILLPCHIQHLPS